MWLDGFERVDIPGDHDGGSYIDTDAPWRLVLHTTEGLGGIESQVGTYAKTGGYPHCTADPQRRRRAQHVSLDRSVTTAKNKSGGVETNRLHAVQVEIIGKAAEARHWPDDVLVWLGEEIVFPMCSARGVALLPPPRAFVDSGFIARPDAPQRLTFAEWNRFGGVCGHQHVPENDHWDPGALNIDRVLEVARGKALALFLAAFPPPASPPAPPVVPLAAKETRMPFTATDEQGVNWYFAGVFRRRITWEQANALAVLANEVPYNGTIPNEVRDAYVDVEKLLTVVGG